MGHVDSLVVSLHFALCDFSSQVFRLPFLRDCLPDELLSRFKSTTVDPSYEPPDNFLIPTINGKTGELMKALPLGLLYRVARRKFRSLCAEGMQVEVGDFPVIFEFY